MINAETTLFGVIGNPIKHSLSPEIHTQMLKKHTINAVYLAFEVSDLVNAINGIRALGIKGVNVTIPHKEAIIQFLDEIDKEAAIIGAVNTVKNENGKLTGYNTDYSGFMRSFMNHVNPEEAKNILVIGAGGSSKAIIYALRKVGYKTINLMNRTEEKAKKLKRKFKELISLNIYPLNEKKPLKEADVIINCTSVGLNDIQTPVDVNLIDKAIVIDIIYKDTPLIKLARQRGLKCVNGVEMFLYQAMYSFEIFTGKKFDLELAKRILKERVK